MVVEIAPIRDIPLYDGDLEAANGIPAAVTDLKNHIFAVSSTRGIDKTDVENPPAAPPYL